MSSKENRGLLAAASRILAGTASLLPWAPGPLRRLQLDMPKKDSGPTQWPFSVKRQRRPVPANPPIEHAHSAARLRAGLSDDERWQKIDGKTDAYVLQNRGRRDRKRRRLRDLLSTRKYGYFSQECLDELPGKLILSDGSIKDTASGSYYSTPNGGEVLATEVHRTRYGNTSSYPDLVYLGPVVKWLRSYGGSVHV